LDFGFLYCYRVSNGLGKRGSEEEEEEEEVSGPYWPTVVHGRPV
jgi:hypothetical protein